MSNYIPKPNTGTLFNNDRKDPGSSQPDMKGYIYLDRALINEQLKNTPDNELVKFDVGAWDNGGRFGMSFSVPYVKPEDRVNQKTQAAEPAVPAAEPAPQPGQDDDVPF